MANPHQPAGNDGGEQVNVNTPIPTEEERTFLAGQPTTAENHLKGLTADGEQEDVETQEEAQAEIEAAPTTSEQQAAANDAEGHPEHHESVEQAQTDLDSKPTTAEVQSDAPPEGESNLSQHDEGVERLEHSAGQEPVEGGGEQPTE